MEIEHGYAKRQSGSGKQNNDFDIDELDQMMEDLNIQQKKQASGNKATRNANSKKE